MLLLPLSDEETEEDQTCQMSCSGHTANKWQTGQLNVTLCDGKGCTVWHGTVCLFSDVRLLLLTAEEA